MSLSESQIQRYSRHVLLPDVGGVGQRRLLASTAAFVLGPKRPASAAALAYLAAAGVGTLEVAGAEDVITEGEVTGNIVLGVEDAGRERLAAVRARIAALNPDVRVTAGEAPGALRIEPDEPDDPTDVAAALVAGGRAAVGAIVTLSRRP